MSEERPPRLVQLETPFAAGTPEEIVVNIDYARRCARHCLDLGEAPFVSHLLYTQMLDDTFKPHRRKGIEGGLAWASHAEASAVYTDLGITPGMEKGIARAEKEGRPVEKRTLPIGYKKMVLPVFPSPPLLCRDCHHLGLHNQCAVLSQDEAHDFVEVLTYVDDPQAASPSGQAFVGVEVDPDRMGCRCFKQR